MVTAMLNAAHEPMFEEDPLHPPRACNLEEGKLVAEATVILGKASSIEKLEVNIKNELRVNSRCKELAKEEQQRGEEEVGLSHGSLLCLLLNRYIVKNCALAR